MGTTDFESAAFDHSAISPHRDRLDAKGEFYQARLIFSAPPMYGRKASGMVIEPSAFW